MPVAEFALQTKPPAIDFVSFKQSAGKPDPGGDSRGVGDAAHPNWGSATAFFWKEARRALFRPTRTAIAQIARIVPAPTFDVAAGNNRALEIFTRAKRNRISEARYTDRLRAARAERETRFRSERRTHSEVRVLIAAPSHRTVRRPPRRTGQRQGQGHRGKRGSGQRRSMNWRPGPRHGTRRTLPTPPDGHMRIGAFHTPQLVQEAG